MSAGTVANVLVCVPTTATPTQIQQQICPKIGSQLYQPRQTQAYLLDKSQQSNFEAAFAQFDYGYASAIWAMSFSTVISLYFVSHGIGLVIGMIRRG
ncbi:hypothetical protein R6242_03580 [Iodobacter sp. CM08]|uniref:hypothetical protein n=1 Tax=Iodobacter sp. CM08 TaxID=3085902 RepID=UPI002981FBEA|nr:hypothetical protein [Iodobacter sp. CM08]MDW5415650.1 hypothetical protein [Iodobacter sp. CM08]